MKTHIRIRLIVFIFLCLSLTALPLFGTTIYREPRTPQQLISEGPRLLVRLKGGQVLFHNERIVAVGEDVEKAEPRPPEFHPLGVLSGDPEFPDGVWSPNGTFERRSADGRYTIRMKVEVDPSGEELGIVKFEGDSSEGGLHMLRLAIENLDVGKGAWILPARGGLKLDASRPVFEHTVDYPTYWGAQMAVYQEKRGGFMIWSTDTTGQFKFFRYLRTNDRASVAFESQAAAPFEEKKRIQAVEWRLRFFEGDWREPAARYRSWMAKAFDLTPLDETTGWAKDVRGFITVLGRNDRTELLEDLSRILIPDKTVLYLPDWRRDNYDVNYPDYTPNTTTPPFVKDARAKGFHVMLHTDLPGVTGSNPAYESVKQYHVKTAVGENRIGWYWDKNYPHSFAFINPAAAAFRRLFVDAMRGIIRDIPETDSIHLDVSAPMWNDGNGLIEGMNYAQGSMALHRELLAALPSVTFGGESLNELTARGERFYQRWELHGPAEPHPIETFLFWPYARPYGYLGLPNPDRSLGAWFTYAKDYEPWSVLPTLTLQGNDTLKSLGPRSMNVLREMRIWQEKALEPDWSGDWKGVVFKWKDGEEHPAATLAREPFGVRMECGRDVLWERVTGVTEHQSSLGLPDWPAFEKGRYYGLNPEHQHLFIQSDLVMPATGIRVTGLSKGAIIDAFQAGRRSLRMSFRRKESAPVARLVELYNRSRVGVTINGADHALERGAIFMPDYSASLGKEFWGFSAHPPWQADGPTPDFKWGQAWADFPVRLPDAANLALRFSVGKDMQTGDGDGATFIVKIDGKEAWTEHLTPGTWRDGDVDLTPWRGKDVTLRLIIDPGPKQDTGWDKGLWRDPVIVQKMKSEPVVWRLQDGSSGKALPGEAIIKFIQPPEKIILPADLRLIPFECALDSMGLYRLGSAWGAGSIMNATAEGISRPALNGHPPDQARSILRFALEIPKDARHPVLTFFAGISDGSTTGGLAHFIMINGKELWRHESNKPGWTPREVDLSPYIGKSILLDLATDSLGDAYFDWAVWGEPAIVEKG